MLQAPGSRGVQKGIPFLKPALAFGGGVLGLALIVLWMGSGKAPFTLQAPEVDSAQRRQPADVKLPVPDTAAQAAIHRAREAAAKGTDLDAQILLWDQAVVASEKTSLRSEAAKERDQLVAQRKDACVKELSQINDTVEGLERQGEIQKAVGYLRSVRNRHATPDWTGPIERSLDGMLGKERSLDRANRALGSVPREGLALWLRSDTGITLKGTRVSRWSDQSDQHRDASEDRESRQPILLPDGLGGKPALSFDGSHTSMSFACPVNGLDGMTLFLVSTCTGDCPKGSGSDSAALYWDAGGPNGKLYLGSFQTKLRFKFGAGKPSGDLSFTRPASLSTRPSLTVMEKEGPVDRLYLDGTLALTQAGMGSKIADCQDRGFLGIGKNDTHFSGLITEVLIYSRALSDPDRQRVEHYLMDKYGLPAK